MSRNNIVIGIAGSGGDGIITAGDLLMKSASKDGLFVFMLKSYGPQIRGGESSIKLRMSQNPVATQGDKLDILVVLNWKDFPRFKLELLLEDEVVIISDSADKFPEEDIPIDKNKMKKWYKIPIAKIAKEASGTTQSKNIVMLGIISELFNLPKETLKKSIKKKFDRKGQKVVDTNINAINAGQNYVINSLEKIDDLVFEYKKNDPRIVMDGNEAIAYGAVYAGLEYFAGYPITPSSEIMQWIAKFLPKYGGTVMQMEDELASINAVIGASFAGKKSMTATSGAGISLMNEGIGLASMTELPAVIVNVQRGGPSTGLPTKTEQADLMQAIWGSHGDSPRVVLAPADVEDCFDTTILAFYIAEKYQMPVIILSDGFIGHRKESINPERIKSKKSGFKKINRRQTPNEEELKDYKRFKYTKTGISPIAYPGIKGGEHQTAGIEHDEYGFPSSDVDIHHKMTFKRYAKYDAIKKEFDFKRFYGDEDAEIGIIAWGSTKGAVKEAVKKAQENGIKIHAIIPQIIYPFLTKSFKEFLKKKKKVIVVEMAYSGPFVRYLRGFVDFGKYNVKIYPYRIPGGAPFTVEEILEQITEVVKK
ncbi:MAG: 2-oxoacid:acceptor oxidoreductase subunit alpha [Candidatus Marinimicrobia bacterium]|nr:2-oxoacid:acceptor oxidoreductase subunit alpha [Candidatus Neomarinimicrobiota bacterium]